MKVVNPLNRAPLSLETMVKSDDSCHCVCSSGSNTSFWGGWNPLTDFCKCSCRDGNDSLNYNSNYQWAHDA